MSLLKQNCSGSQSSRRGGYYPPALVGAHRVRPYDGSCGAHPYDGSREARKENKVKYINELCERREKLNAIKADIVKAYETIRDCYKNGNKVLICGNGGSAADSAHITGELMKSFKKKRMIDETFEKKIKKQVENFFEKNMLSDVDKKMDEIKDALEKGLPTIDLTAFSGLNTAFANDKNPDYVFANSVLGLGLKEDVLIAITTSGSSRNVVNAAIVARALDMKVVALTGKGGGCIKDIADVNIVVDNDETFMIQEEHIAIYHAICLDIEEEFF